MDAQMTKDGNDAHVTGLQLLQCSLCVLRPDRLVKFLRSLREPLCLKKRLEALINRDRQKAKDARERAKARAELDKELAALQAQNSEQKGGASHPAQAVIAAAAVVRGKGQPRGNNSKAKGGRGRGSVAALCTLPASRTLCGLHSDRPAADPIHT